MWSDHCLRITAAMPASQQASKPARPVRPRGEARPQSYESTSGHASDYPCRLRPHRTQEALLTAACGSVLVPGVEQSAPHVGNRPVRRRVSIELDSVQVRPPIEPRPCNPVPTIHETAFAVEDDGVAQVSRLYTACVLSHLAASGRAVAEPTILIELGDVGDGNRHHGQALGCGPEALSPPELAHAIDDAGVSLSLLPRCESRLWLHPTMPGGGHQ